MTAGDFVMGLLRLTVQGRAQWRVSASKSTGPPARAYLALGDYRFVLEVGGQTPRLMERGAAKRRPLVLDAPGQVKALAEMVVAQLTAPGRARPIIVPDGIVTDQAVPEKWAALLRQAGRVMTTAEEQRAEHELFRRLGGEG